MLNVFAEFKHLQCLYLVQPVGMNAHFFAEFKLLHCLYLVQPVGMNAQCIR